MKKVVLSLSLASAIALAEDGVVDLEKLNADIAAAKSEKSVAEAKLKALQAQIPQDTRLITHTELGYIETSGNTNTQTFNLDAQAKKSWGNHSGQIIFDGQYATQNQIETKNKFLTELSYDYSFSKHFAFNYLVGYKKDRFSGFDYQFYTGPGAKYKALKTTNHELSFDGNILYSLDSYESVNLDASGNIIAYPNPNNIPTVSSHPAYDDQYASYRVKGVYNWQILSNLKFDQELTFRGSFEKSENYFAYSKSSLTTKFSDILSGGLSYKVDYINLPAEGKEPTDTTFTANLIIDY
ncbi:MAG: DUF481 domain-containing protein [Campylobacterales bacterium]|nr:DUF481 domain-containing protein [Campylobacterales bacterium]